MHDTPNRRHPEPDRPPDWPAPQPRPGERGRAFLNRLAEDQNFARRTAAALHEAATRGRLSPVRNERTREDSTPPGLGPSLCSAGHEGRST